MKKMTQWFSKGLVATALFSATLLAGIATEAQAAKKFITLGTAGVKGVYYPLGGTICRRINLKSKEHGIECAVMVSGGSIDNLNALRHDERDFAFAQSDWQYSSYEGTGIFADFGADKSLRSLFSLHSEALTIVARKDKNINILDDLIGKRVNIGNPGSGMRATMNEVMRVKGWTKKTFAKATEFKPSEQEEKLCNDEIDAFVFATGHPNGAISQVMHKCNAHLVSIEGPAIDALLKEQPYYAPATIRGGMYAGNMQDVKTFGVKATLVTSKDMNEEIVYQIVKAIMSDFKEFKTTHPILSTLSQEHMVLDGLTAPLHEGAKRYYREAGLIKK